MRTTTSDARPSGENLGYLLRCGNCHGILTKLEILDAQERNTLAFRAGRPHTCAVCECGSREYTPTNLTRREQRAYLSLWQLICYALGRRDDRTKVWHLALAAIRSDHAALVPEGNPEYDPATQSGAWIDARWYERLLARRIPGPTVAPPPPLDEITEEAYMEMKRRMADKVAEVQRVAEGEIEPVDFDDLGQKAN